MPEIDIVAYWQAALESSRNFRRLHVGQRQCARGIAENREIWRHRHCRLIRQAQCEQRLALRNCRAGHSPTRQQQQ